MKTIFNLKKIILFIFFSTTLTYCQLNTNIKLNQIGFYPNGPKIVALVNCDKTIFTLKPVGSNTIVFTGNLSASKTWSLSGENIKTADFTNFSTTGDYILNIDGYGNSYPFKISNTIYSSLNKALLKAYYYNRSSTALETQYAGQWARAAGHLDTNVTILPQAASPSRPAGTKISCPKGWYDAGDYNSYIVNSGISTYTLMMSYEQFPDYYKTLNTNIPESNNTTPDILDEIKWNLDWMLSMQDPIDGGVYTKKTEVNFNSTTMPAQSNQARYLTSKTTVASADFAAVMAVAYRIYKNTNPTFANTCLTASKKAFVWVNNNPNAIYQIATAQGIYPEIKTGNYGLNDNAVDEIEWAANELYIATKDDNYYNKGFNNNNNYDIPSWPNVRTLGLISLLYNSSSLTARGKADVEKMKAKLKFLADNLTTYQLNVSPYKIAMGKNGSSDFPWGSNSVATNQAMILINAYKVFNNRNYAIAAISNLDYILGRNATGYSFVTGFGEKKVINIHHRISTSDNIVEPVPGWLAGGPTTTDGGDNCFVDLAHPAKSYTDNKDCWSKNEIAINWNAPAVYITSALIEFTSITTNNPTGPAGYTFSVNEGGTVPANATIDIAYGTNGSYNYLYNVSSNTPCNNTTFGDPIPGVVKGCFVKNSSSTTAPIGSIITLQASNNKFVTSANGTAPMFCDRTVGLDLEKFTVIDATNGKIALRSSNGKYVSSENGNIAMTCNRTSIGVWEKFDWVILSADKIALKGSNGKFVSSENGAIAMNCNRQTTGLWEKFNWTNMGTARVSNGINYNEAITNEAASVYPNPITNVAFLDVEANTTIKIIDLTGKTVYGTKSLSSETVRLELNHLNNGIYIIETTTTKASNFQKIVIQK